MWSPARIGRAFSPRLWYVGGSQGDPLVWYGARLGAGAFACGETDSLVGMTDRKARARTGLALWSPTLRKRGEGWGTLSRG